MNTHVPGDLKAPAYFKGILRLRLPSGQEYDVLACMVVDVVSAADCCGGPAVTMIRMAAGHEYHCDHPGDVVRDLLASARRDRDGLFG